MNWTEIGILMLALMASFSMGHFCALIFDRGRELKNG